MAVTVKTNMSLSKDVTILYNWVKGLFNYKGSTIRKGRLIHALSVTHLRTLASTKWDWRENWSIKKIISKEE